MNKIKVLVVEPQKAPYVKEIDNTLEAKQEIVGGLIEQLISPKDDVAIILNEEGKLHNLPMNRALYGPDKQPVDIIRETFLLCLAPPDIESYASLTDELIEKYRKRFSIEEVISVSEEDNSVFVLHQPLDNVELIYR